MSRTYRNYGPHVNPNDWFKPWQAKGDHNRNWWIGGFEAAKRDCHRLNRQEERMNLRLQNFSDEYEDYDDDIIFTPYKKMIDFWCYD